ncbi:MAG: Crp/Fnr family transcriptional regulator [Sphingomicrobium sp.]
MENSHKSSLSLFLQRLLLRSALTPEEQRAILGLGGETRRYIAHSDVVRPGESVESACLIARGLLARYDQMLDGQRQITSFYIPGDMCDLHSVVVPKASWSITAISPSTVKLVPHSELRDLCTRFPAIAMAFWRDGTVDSSVFGKWVGNLGRKNAKARIAHIMCEMGTRIEAAGFGTRTHFELKVTQDQLADAAGLTSVHVNRTLQELRKEGLLKFDRGRVEVPDWDQLASAAEFDPTYLMLDSTPQRLVATSGGSQPASIH